MEEGVDTSEEIPCRRAPALISLCEYSRLTRKLSSVMEPPMTHLILVLAAGEATEDSGGRQ